MNSVKIEDMPFADEMAPGAMAEVHGGHIIMSDIHIQKPIDNSTPSGDGPAGTGLLLGSVTGALNGVK